VNLYAIRVTDRAGVRPISRRLGLHHMPRPAANSNTQPWSAV